MTPAQLRRLGRKLYGERWQTAMALALGVADRTVRRWAAGSSAVPDTVRLELIAALRIEAARLVALADELEAKT